MYGAWSGSVYNCTEKMKKSISKNVGVKAMGSINSFSDLTVTFDGYESHIGTIDEEAFKLSRIKLSEGNLPKQKNEIAIEQPLLKQIDKNAKLGDIIKVPIKNRVSIDDISPQEFILSGIIHTWNQKWMKEDFKLPSLFVTENAFSPKDLKTQMNIFFILNNSGETSMKRLEALLRENKESTYIYNSKSYSMTRSLEDSFFETGSILGVVGVTAFVIILYLLSGRLKDQKYKLILMKGLGADNGHLFRIVLWESLYIWNRSIIIGGPLVCILLLLLFLTVKVAAYSTLAISINWLSLLLIAGFITLTFFMGNVLIFFSVIHKNIFSAFKKENIHTLKSSLPVVKKITPFLLYKKNRVFYKEQSLLRICLSVFSVVMLTTNTIDFINGYSRYVQDKKNVNFDYTLQIYDIKNGLTKEEIGKLEKLDGIIGTTSEKILQGMQKPIKIQWEGWNGSEYVNTLRKNSFESSHENKQLNEAQFYESNLIMSINKGDIGALEWYKNKFPLSAGILDTEKFIQGEQCILVMSPFSLSASTFHDVDMEIQPFMDYKEMSRAANVYDYAKEENQIKAGDFIHIESEYGNAAIEVGLVVTEVTGFAPQDIKGIHIGSGTVSVGEGFFNKLTASNVENLYNHIQLKSFEGANYTDTDWQIENLVHSLLGSGDSKYHLNRSRFASEIAINQSMSKMMRSIILGLITLIIFISTIFIGTNNRMEDEKKRITILRSIGMERKRVRKMYFLEYLSEGILAGLIGLSIAGIIQLFALKQEFGYDSIIRLYHADKTFYPAANYFIPIGILIIGFYLLVHLLCVVIPVVKNIKSFDLPGK